MTAAVRAPAPIWFWIIAVLAVIWNGFPVMLYLQLQFSGPPQGMPAEQLAYFEAFPAWYVAVWALTVFTSFASSAALLLRSRLAAPGFLIAIGLYGVSVVYHYALADAWRILGPGNAAFSAVIALSLVLLWWFSRTFAARGVLR